MADIADQVTAEQCFGIEYEDKGLNRFLTVRFWKGQSLCRVLICRSGLPASGISGELGSLARLLSVVSTRADVVACSGVPVELLQTLDQSPHFARGVQSCFRFEQLSLSKLIHKTRYNVFGHIDFFSVLKALMISLGNSLSEDWMQRSSALTQVTVARYCFPYSFP